ncbi:MAG: hypothetical protein LBF59_03980 [Prevotellaceae bacterium]|jgi:hypothetical protein|nr:hypothetical protein [Prevotellaceae bacterium]
MAYTKDSGESKLRKNVNPEAYINKKNKSIFKTSQTQQFFSKPQHKANYDWEIPEVDMDIPNIEEPKLEEKETPRYNRDKIRYEKKEPQSFYEYERRRKEESESGEPKQELLSFRDIIGIIVANGLVPIVGGFVYYIILSSKGEKQKAAQSIVLSAIVSIIRIMYLVNS